MSDTTFYINETGTPITLSISDGASTFLNLSDTPSSFSGQSGKYLGVVGGETGLTFLSIADAITSHSSLTDLNWSSAGHTIDSAVDFNHYSLTNPSYIDFSVSGALVSQERRAYWDDDNGTLSLGLKGGTANLQVGQEIVLRGTNNESSQIANGKAAYISGANGNNILLNLSDQREEVRAHKTIAIATEDIDSSQKGYFTTFGFVRDIDTAAFSEGDIIYLGESGSFTGVQPDYDKHSIKIGTVTRSHGSEGSIFVNIEKESKIEELHNVVVSSLVSGEALVYNGSYWENSVVSQTSSISGA